MGLFNYKELGSDESRALFRDALTLTQAFTDSAGKSLGSSDWKPVSASQLYYEGPVDSQGFFTGRGLAPTADAAIMGKYEGEKLVSIGISFRGTGVGGTVLDLKGDLFSNLLMGVSRAYADNYVKHAFDSLMGKVASYAQLHGITGSQVIVSGHSQGGAGVNSLAALSATDWCGFFKDANYVSFASPTQNAGVQVLDAGWENDPVFRVLGTGTLNLASFGVHDAPLKSVTNNIVNFNDQYASLAENHFGGGVGALLGAVASAAASLNVPIASSIAGAVAGKLARQGILNVDSWTAHSLDGYIQGMTRVVDSAFYNLTHRDSTVIVANLSDTQRARTWVEDLNRYAEKHTGSTFIIGTDGNDLLKGGAGNDYIEGGAGNDVFRDSGGYNVILGGAGYNTFHLQSKLSDYIFAYDGHGTLYIKDSGGGISTTHDIDAVVGQYTHVVRFLWWSVYTHRWDVTYEVTDDGLKSDKRTAEYAPTTKRDDGENVLMASPDGEWMFGLDGDDVLLGGKGNDHFVGGFGNDRIVSGGGIDTYLFSGGFGNDIIEGFSVGHKLIFQRIEGLDTDFNYRSHISIDERDAVISFGSDSVTLVGVGADQLNSTNFIIA